MTSALRKGIETAVGCVHKLRPTEAKLQGSTRQMFLQQKINHINCSRAVEKFLDSYDTFLFDCDGVLWENDHVTPLLNVAEAIKKLQKLDKKIIYVTNNSTVSRHCLAKKFKAHGFESNLQNIFGNSYASAVYLKDIAQVTGKVYVVGSQGMKWELDRLEIENFGTGHDEDKPSADINKLLEVKLHENVEAVLVGFDPHVNFMKVYKAASYLCNDSCHFIATNNVESSIYIGDNMDRRMPMTGMMVNSIADAAHRKPVIVGKPHNLMFQCLLKKHPDINKTRTVFVGDSLKADMGFAKTIGVDSVLVLTGTGTMNQIHEMPHLAPDHILNSVADIL